MTVHNIKYFDIYLVRPRVMFQNLIFDTIWYDDSRT